MGLVDRVTKGLPEDTSSPTEIPYFKNDLWYSALESSMREKIAQTAGGKNKEMDSSAIMNKLKSAYQKSSDSQVRFVLLFKSLVILK